MTATAALLAFTLAAAILTITPGLDNALVLRTAAVEGSRRALMAGLGISAGCLLWGAIAAFGLGSLLAVSTLAYDTLRICAAIYLFYLGIKLLWSTRAVRKNSGQAAKQISGTGTEADIDTGTRTGIGTGTGTGTGAGNCTAPPASRIAAATRPDSTATAWFVRGCLTNALNPKVGVFYITFLPQFIPAGADVLRFSLLLATVHAIVGMLWFVLLVAATRPLARWLSRPAVTRGLDRVTGAVFIAFGLRLALEKR
ncbi:LysE family translocator [Achromobacter mucicolens]|uniref:LysE family translocator n=1 Tax=Achromobacter mucicolens TaxID=1389922 RepID=UPI0020A5747E|nr:LysE family translocator [Achromobacter mucicolens]MCP2513972.1 LysE family translocator [Achromobacter mucicolens]